MEKIVTELDLKNIDLSSNAHLINQQEFRNYYLGAPGQEHYKLLAHYSMQFNDSVLLDIGTYKGCSALALSYNPKNQVKSFDIRPGLRNISNHPANIEFIVDNILNKEYESLIISSKLILLDTDHLGDFEREFYTHLKSIKYKGLLLLDDIKLNSPMISFWESITDQKYDISNIGHHSGTGLVILE